MPKLENFTTYVKVDSNPYPKNGLLYQVSDNVVSLYYANKHDERTVERAWGQYDDWTNADDVKYVSVDALTTDLDSYLFESNLDLALEIAAGNITNTEPFNKFGANPESANGVIEDVWDGGGTYVFPTSAVITHVSQKVDQAAMRNQIVQVQGLDANWDLIQQEAILDGTDTTTPVALTTPMIRCFRMKVLANVVTDENLSTHNAANNQDFAIILAGNNQTLMAIFTVPDSTTAFISSYYCDYVRDAVKDPDAINFTMWGADRKNGFEFQIKHAKGLPKQAGGFQHFFNPYYRFTERTDIIIRAVSTGADANVHAGFDVILC